jgi:hypothetical protein
MTIPRISLDAQTLLRPSGALLLILLLTTASLATAQVSEFDVSVDQSYLAGGSDETSAWIPCPFGGLCPRNGETWGTDDPIYLPGLGIEAGDLIRLTAVGSVFVAQRRLFGI